MVKFTLYIILLAIICGCSSKVTEIVFSRGERFSNNVEIFYPERDTLLIVRGSPTGTSYYSYHVVDYTDTATVLRNVLNLKPVAELLSNQEDSLFSLVFVDSDNNKIEKTNPQIIINDSIVSMYDSYNSTFNFFHKIDSIISLKLLFGEGFEFYTENLSKGNVVIKLLNYQESNSRSNRTIMYHSDYYIASEQKVVLNDTSTLSKTMKLNSNCESFKYRGTLTLKRKEINRIFNWNNVPLNE